MSMRLYNMICVRVAAAVFMSLLTVSCAKDPTAGRPEPEPGIPVKVQISFRIPKYSYPQAAAGRTVADASFHVDLLPAPAENQETDMDSRADEEPNPLYNLWVLQFSADGTIRKTVRLSTTDEPVYENKTLEAELLTGSDQTIYLLSLGKQYGTTDLSSIRTLSDLESTSFNFVRYENGLPVPVIQNTEDVPYRGSCDKLTIIRLEENGAGYVDYRNSPGFTGSINMKALVSLVTMDYSYKVDGMTPFSISLNNVPTTFVVNNANYKPSQFVNLPAILLKPTDLADGKRSTLSWYMAPNRQGTIPSITAETDRYFYYRANSSTTVGTAPRDGTYIHFWASKNSTPDNYALYYMFLGGNTTNDFNINPHSHYRYRTDINTADDINDKRIIFKTLKQTIDFAASRFVNAAGNTVSAPDGARNSDKYDLDVHPDMRPIELTALRGTVSAEILSAPGDASPIAPENSWLKLSTYPNYTEALNGQREGSTTALTTAVTFNVTVPGLFRLYLYSDEYEKYITDNPNNFKRSLFVRFTFRTETDRSDTYIAQMDQIPGFYAGQFGGELILSDQGTYYPKAMVMEARQENNLYGYLSYYPSSWSLYGAYAGSNVVTDAILRQYGAYDTHNGREATIQMAENRHGLSVIAKRQSDYSAYLDKITVPHYINGHPDLYQYKNYTGDIFAQRWCYDKNRDMDGNGYLTDDEIVWYAPSANQILSLAMNYYTTKTDYLRNTSATTGLGHSILQSVTMYSSTNIASYSLNELSNSNSSYPAALNMRCVRDVDVDVDAGGPGGLKYYEQDGYAVIDATGLMPGIAEDRVNNPNVVILPADNGGDPNYIGRVKRHYVRTGGIMHDIDQKVSLRFRVAPRDINASGNLVSQKTHITWAEAAGYNTAANTLPVTAELTEVAETGCPAFKGIDGVEDSSLGKWRLPTLREAFLIQMFDKAMAATNAVTGYVPLYLSGTGFYYNYWTATEEEDGSGDYYKNRAVTLTSSSKVAPATPVGNPYVRVRDYNKKGAESYNQVAARCIQDLP